MTHQTAMEEQERAFAALIERAARGDMIAFRGIVERHHPFFYGVALRFLRDRQDAEDVAQEAWVRIWNNLPRYRPAVKFTTWGYRIVIHLCLDSARSVKRRNTVPLSRDDSDDGEAQIADRPTGGADIESRDLCDRILSLARTLPPKERLVFQLRDVQDCSMAEVAEIMEITENAVRANLCHARKRIREMMDAAERPGIA